VGTIEFRSIIESVRAHFSRVKYVEAFARSIDFERNTLRCVTGNKEAEEFELDYHHLVVGVGATTDTFGIAGVNEHCLFLKELADAREIRQGLIALLERAETPTLNEEERMRLLQVVVIGGGPTGVEFAAELQDFVREDLKELFPLAAGQLKVSVLEASGELLGSFSERLRDYTMRRMRATQIEVRTNARVTEVFERKVRLDDGSDIPFGLAIWTAGIAPVPFCESLPVKKTDQGLLLTTDYLNLIDHENVFAIGDCAAVEGKHYPQTAQRAEGQGKYVAKLIDRERRGLLIKPFSFFNLGMLAYIGKRRALADLPGVSGYGFVTWLFWRSVYLTKIVSVKNRILVLFDWFKTAVFGRDVSRF